MKDLKSKIPFLILFILLLSACNQEKKSSKKAGHIRHTKIPVKFFTLKDNSKVYLKDVKCKYCDFEGAYNEKNKSYCINNTDGLKYKFIHESYLPVTITLEKTHHLTALEVYLPTEETSDKKNFTGSITLDSVANNDKTVKINRVCWDKDSLEIGSFKTSNKGEKETFPDKKEKKDLKTTDSSFKIFYDLDDNNEVILKFDVIDDSTFVDITVLEGVPIDDLCE